MASERKVVYFNVATESEEYQEANSMQFSTEVKRWLSERVRRKKALLERKAQADLTIDLGER